MQLVDLIANPSPLYKFTLTGIVISIPFILLKVRGFTDLKWWVILFPGFLCCLPQILVFICQWLLVIMFITNGNIAFFSVLIGSIVVLVMLCCFVKRLCFCVLKRIAK